MRRVTALLLVLALAAPAAARGDTATFTPTADARVEAGKPSANFGSNRWLKAGASPKTHSYLRFDVALPAGSTVTRATLRLYATRSSAGAGYQAYPVSESNWQESSITYNSRPAISATAIGSSGGWSGTGYEAAALAAGSIEPGVQTIAVQTTRNSSQSFESREGARDPQLVVTYAPPASPISTPGNQPSPAPAWSDEFNGAAGTPTDPASWTVRTGGKWMSGGSPELQCYTTRPENVSHDGLGHLQITARYEPDSSFCWGTTSDYRSARIDSSGKREFQYGRIEARIKLPAANGTWPAWWMLGSGCCSTIPWPEAGEIDVLEYRPGPAPLDAHHAVHGETTGGTRWQISFNTNVGVPWSSDWHVYGARWAQDRIKLQVDGRTRWAVTRADMPSGGLWAFNRPFFLLLNIAVGRWGCSAAPSPCPDPAQFPAATLVDWVRVY